MQPKFKEKFAYWFDNYMAKGAWSIFIALIIVFLVGFVLISVVKLIFGVYLQMDTIESGPTIWRIFLQLTDPGNMAQDNDSSWYLKIFSVVSGMFGIIFFSAVIAFLTTQLDLKLESLKKGKSKVLEKNHVLILGWNVEVVEIIRELIIANESESKASVVILSEEPKEEMDDFFNDQIKERLTTKIITRTGETSSLNALHRVSVNEAKSVIILPTCSPQSDDELKTHSDAHTLKTMLALVAACQDEEEKPNIVAQVYNLSNREIIKSLSPENITIVDPEDMVAKIAVQTSRSSGLAAVYTSLIGFDGCEFYFTKSKWNNVLFKDIQYHYPDGVVIGIQDNQGEIIVHPELNYQMKDDDKAIILAEDDSTIKYNSKQLYTPQEISILDKKLPKEKEKVLIIGWNNKAKTIIEQYQDYIIEGSEIHIVLPVKDEEIVKGISVIKNSSKEYEIKLMIADLFQLENISRLSPESYNSIIILNSIDDDQEKADASTINILLLLREVIKRRSKDKPVKTQIISEVMNSENLELISKTGVNDAIISTKMVSKVLAQIAEEPDILAVYEEIFKEEGSEIYLKPLSLYVDTIDKDITFGDCIRIAQQRNEICLGYRHKVDENNVEKEFGVIINPPKDKKIELSVEDSLIVISEDEL
ncbi:MAG: hypothetical protein MJB14_10590 [Spirochaetes bacterium]|nr:hypothetical protein [Spirochaetota bacterium]